MACMFPHDVIACCTCLQNDIRGLTEAQLLANGRAVKQFKDHYRNHKDVPYKVGLCTLDKDNDRRPT